MRVGNHLCTQRTVHVPQPATTPCPLVCVLWPCCCCLPLRLPYQVAGEAQSFLDHIRLGRQAAEHDPSALLLFSGGQTRKAAGPRSEGLSYWLVAEAADWFGHPDVRSRAYTEVRLLTLWWLLSSAEQHEGLLRSMHGAGACHGPGGLTASALHQHLPQCDPPGCAFAVCVALAHRHMHLPQ